MGVIVSKFWRFCLWLEGGEGVGLVAETRVIEGNYRRTQQEGLLDILEEKLDGVADVERLKKAVSAETILRVKHKEAEQGELFSSVWEFVVIRICIGGVVGVDSAQGPQHLGFRRTFHGS